MKDKLLLLFWGVLCGAVFVGAILCFGSIINWMGAHQQLSLPASLCKAGIGAVIAGAIYVIGKVAGKVLAKQHIKQAARLLPPECLAAALQSPVGKAVIEQREDHLEYFLAKLGDSSIYNGMTALHIAAVLGNTKFCKYLLKYGADAHLTDKSGRTAADWAHAHGYEATEQFLNKYAEKSAFKVLK